MPIPGAPSGIGDGLSRLSTAVDQHNQGVTGDQTSPWTRAANTPNAMLGVGQQYAHSVGQTVDAWKNLTAPATPGGPPPTAGQVTARAIRATQQTVGAIMGGLTLIKSALDVGFANLTAPIAAIFPSLPAATITSPYIGTPHAHPTHPPSGPPPVPPTPMPSIGMVTLGVSTRVLINSMPAARVDDIGLAPTCCGLPVAWFKIKTGSSNVFVGGVRAARLSDICKACPMIPETPSASAGKAMAAIGKAANVASKVLQYGGIAAGALGYAADMAEAAVEDDAALAAGKALDAATTAAQMAMDIAKMAVEAMMWKDVPVIPPTGSIGAIVDPSHVNVLIGGFPMINIPDPVSALLNRLSRYTAASPPANEGCGQEGEPVDVVTGANLEDSTDCLLFNDLSVFWRRYYDSSRCDERGPLGWGWRHEFEGELRLDVDGVLYVPGTGSAIAFPALATDGASSVRSGVVLRRVNKSTYQLKQGGQLTREFSFPVNQSVGKLARLFDNIGSIQFAYDREGRLTRIRRSADTAIDLEYDSRALLIRIVRLEGKPTPKPLVTYEYDRNENLVGWIDPCGNRATLEYDDQHRITRKGDRRGYSYHYSYDDLSRCVHTWGEDGMYDVRLTYLDEIRCTKATHGDGGVWTFFYDENRTITQILDPYGRSRKRIVNSLGKVVSEVDAAGIVYRIAYDMAGGIVGWKDPFGYLSRQMTDHRRRNNLALRIPATALEWEFGALLSRSANRTPALASSPIQSTAIRDPLGRKVEEAIGENIVRRWVYDGNGNTLKYEDGDGSISRFEYTSWNLLHRQIDPLGNTTEYEYTARERLAKVVDPGGTTSEYSYDLRDNLVKVVRNGKVREEYVRDQTDNLVEKRDGAGRTILSFQIGAGNLKTLRRLASGEKHYFEYDAAARLTRAATDSHEILFEYGCGRRPISDIRNGRGVRHQRERLGRTRLTVLNRFAIRYSRNGSELTIVDPTGARHRLMSQGAGMVNFELANGTTEASQYDSNGRCISKARSRPGRGRPWLREYHYSNEGDLLAVNDSRSGVSRYEYDAAHRLTGEWQPGGSHTAYRYDLADNLLEQPGLFDVVTEGSCLVAASRKKFSYNDRDHIASYVEGEQTVHFEYDSCDRLVRCMTPGGEWRSSYDPLGRRIEKTWKGSTAEYFWDDNRIAAERRENGRLRIYIYADLNAIVPFMFVDYASEEAPLESGERYFIATDQIGVPLEIEDDRGEIVWRAKTSPYGVAQLHPGNRIDFSLRFPGHYEDSEIGLFYNRFRHYSPVLGRYIQSDPIGVAGGKNLYAYPANPLTTADIFGLHPPKSGAPGGDPPSTGPDEEDPGGRYPPRTPTAEAIATDLANALNADIQALPEGSPLRNSANAVGVLTHPDPDNPEGPPLVTVSVSGSPAGADNAHTLLAPQLDQMRADGTISDYAFGPTSTKTYPDGTSSACAEPRLGDGARNAGMPPADGMAVVSRDPNNTALMDRWGDPPGARALRPCNSCSNPDHEAHNMDGIT
jgi:RHS repeat-associated protein